MSSDSARSASELWMPRRMFSTVDALRDVVDDLGLGQHRAHARDRLRARRARATAGRCRRRSPRGTSPRARGSRPSPPAHFSFMWNSLTLPPSRRRIAREHCAPMSSTKRASGKSVAAPARPAGEIGDLDVAEGHRVAAEPRRGDVADRVARRSPHRAQAASHGLARHLLEVGLGLHLAAPAHRARPRPRARTWSCPTRCRCRRPAWLAPPRALGDRARRGPPPARARGRRAPRRARPCSGPPRSR